MKKIAKFFLLITIVYLIFPIMTFAEPKELIISAAISLKNVFQEIGKIYEEQHKIRCVFNFGAPGALLKQIEYGAPVDIFASAAQKDVDEAIKLGLAMADTRANFAINSVVLIIPSNGEIAIKSFEDLALNEVGKIADGNFKTVPAGRYAEEVFNFYKLLPSIREKLIYAENVRQVLDYVANNEVDAGVVYITDANIRTKDVVVVTHAPEKSHKPVSYPICIIKDSKYKEESKAFISLLLSEEGSKILQKYGFQLIK